MSGKTDIDKEWKRIIAKCLADLGKQGIIPTDVKEMTGRLVLDLNLNQGGISDIDVSIKRRYK